MTTRWMRNARQIRRNSLLDFEVNRSRNNMSAAGGKQHETFKKWMNWIIQDSRGFFRALTLCRPSTLLKVTVILPQTFIFELITAT